MSIAESAPAASSAKTSILLCTDLPESVLAAVGACGYRVTARGPSHFLMHPRASELASVDIVLLDVSAGGEDMIMVTRRLRSAICMSGSAAPILCFSVSRRSARFVLELTKCGVRYVRIADLPMLLDAIELLLAETAYIAHKGPCFRIRHRFSRGSCGPGEEIEAVELVHDGGLIQLSLSLSSRFMFNCLAESRSLALDALQIASRLNGWFYRQHAVNSGMKQTAKVRVATVKVLALRIRQAMASAFARAGSSRDPYDVLRSFSAEGSTRTLYRLRADILWDHLPG